MDVNAAIVQLLAERQAEIVTLRQQLAQVSSERDALRLALDDRAEAQSAFED